MTTSPPSETDLEVPWARLERARLWLHAIASATDLLIVGGTPEPDVVSAMGELQKVTGAERVIIQVTRQSAPWTSSRTTLRASSSTCRRGFCRCPTAGAGNWRRASWCYARPRTSGPPNAPPSTTTGFASCALVPLKVGRLLLQGEVPLEYAYAIVHGQTGETRWLHQRNVLIRDAYGRPVALEGIVTDVTQRQVAEARLRSRESTLQTILSSAPIGIGFNSDRTLLMVNDELCRMTGYTSEEPVGKVTDFLYPTYKEFQRVGVDLVAQLEQGTTGSVETQWVRKDGTVLDVLLLANCITPEDYVLRVTFTVLDITRFRRG